MAPVTQKCLDSDRARTEFGDEEDEMNEVMKGLKEQNDQCTFFLTLNGYDGSALACKLNKNKVTAPITCPNTQQRIEILARARTCGALFHATGGGHITHDDFFKSMEISVREKEIKPMEKEKAHRISMQQYAEEAFAMLQKNKSFNDLIVKELDILLLWYKMPKIEWGDKKKKLEKWNEVKDRKPPFFAPWTDEDEDKLDQLKKKEIKFDDTALGRLVNVWKREHYHRHSFSLNCDI